MNFNQLTIIGYIGKSAETKQLPNGIPATKFSVATTRSWKDDKGEWKDKTQWHTVVAHGQSFTQAAARLIKGAHLFVQGELTTREYDRTIQVPVGKKTIEHVIQQTGCRTKGRHHPPSRSRQQLRCESSACSQQRRCPPLRGTHPRICTVPDETALASQAYSATPSRPSTVLCAPTLFFRTDRCPVVS